jgi:hypothetical protein
MFWWQNVEVCVSGYWCAVICSLKLWLLFLLLAFIYNRQPWALALCWCMFQLLWLPLTSQVPWLCSVVPFGSWLNSEESQNNSQRISFPVLKLLWELIREHKNLTFSSEMTLACKLFPNGTSYLNLCLFWNSHWIENIIKNGFTRVSFLNLLFMLKVGFNV